MTGVSKNRKTCDASGLRQGKKSGKQRGWSLAWVSTIWKGSVPLLLMCLSPGRMILRELPSGCALPLLEPKALVISFTGGAGGWTAAACGVQEFRVNNWTVCMALNSVNMWRIQFAADGSTSALEMFIPVPGGCPGSSSPLVSLLQLFLFIKRVKCLQHFA